MAKRKRKRSQFGSSASEHTRQAGKAAAEIEHAAALTVNKARNGRCTAATLAYADMQQAIGRYEAHTQSGGQAWMSATAVRDAAYEYNQQCVRVSPEDRWDGTHRRRRRR